MRLPLCVAAWGLATAASAQDVYMVTRSAVLHQLDPVSLASLQQVPITTAGNVFSANGLAYHPGIGQLLVVIRADYGTYGNTSTLATLDPATGVATAIGEIGMAVAGLAVMSDGRVLAVTGDGSVPAETVVALDPLTGAPTILASLGNGDDGEAIAAGPEPDQLYHLSGYTSHIFERVDTDTWTPTTIASSFAWNEGTAIAWSVSRNAFLVGELGGGLYQLEKDGSHALVSGGVGDTVKGLAIRGQPHFLLTGTCPGTIDVLFTGLTPNADLGVVGADGFGSFALPGGPCAGEPSVLNGPSFAFIKRLTANGNGSLTLQRTLQNNAWCGTWVQAVDLQSCLLTNGARVP